jgi:hypothetical protein
MKHNFEKTRNLKLILSVLEQFSHRKINFHKKVVLFREAQNEVNANADLFDCEQGLFLMRYLGIPIYYGRFIIAEGKIVEEILQKLLSSCKCTHLSLGRRLILIDSVRTNMVLYMVSFFLLSKGVLHKLDYYWSRFFWQGDIRKMKYQLAIWSVVLPSQGPS